jgi:CBS domain-containing protein
MRAIDLAESVPTVRRETTGAEAARVMAEYRLPGLVVANDSDVPIAVIPGSQLLSLVLPQYIRDDPALAHVFDEEGADRLCAKLNNTTIGELLDSQRLKASKPPSVLPEDTLVEIASAMVTGRLPLILVTDSDGAYRGCIMMSRALAAIATAAGQNSRLIRRRLERDILQPPDPGEPPTSSA